MTRDLMRRAALGTALLAAFAATTAPTAQAAPAPVPCQHTTGDHYDCSFWPAGDGQSGGAPVLNAGGTRVGYLHKGTNYVICQELGSRVASGQYSNVWWAWTLADNNQPGWVNAVWAGGGDNDGPFATVPPCNGAHGPAPGGTPTAPPPPGSPPPPPPAPPPPPGQTDPRQVAVESTVNWALSKVGTHQCAGEQPAWNKAFGFGCTVAWCGVFAGTALEQAGFVVDHANYVGPPRVVSHVGVVTGVGGGTISTVEGNTNEPSVVATHQYNVNNSKVVGIVRVSGLKGQPAGFRQYKAPNTKLRRKLQRRLRKIKHPDIEVGPRPEGPEDGAREAQVALDRARSGPHVETGSA